MKASEVRQMAALADRHFWFRGTRKVILDWARNVVGNDLSDLRIADIGCGPGTTLAYLSDVKHLVGVDMSSCALSLAKERAPTARLIAADAAKIPLGKESFDLVFCLDMLEHLPAPEKAASEIFRILKPGSHLVATVPAWQFLFGEHDHALGHYRRYRKPAFRALLEEAGFEDVRVSYYNAALFPPIAIMRGGKKLFTKTKSPDEEGQESDLRPLPKMLNSFLEGLLSGERHILRHMNLPFGISLIASAKRPD